MTSWFVVSYGRDQHSAFAHAFATMWASREDGEARSACGQSPYDHVADASRAEVGFIPSRDEEQRCPKCVAALAMRDDVPVQVAA